MPDCPVMELGRRRPHNPLNPATSPGSDVTIVLYGDCMVLGGLSRGFFTLQDHWASNSVVVVKVRLMKTGQDFSHLFG